MNQKILIPFLACFLVPLAGLSTDIYLPSLPAMSHYFLVPKSTVQLTVIVYTLGLGIMQFIAGPISDALGRKKLLLVALLVQAISVLIILYIYSMGWVVIGRLVQGMGAAFVSVPARAMLSDTFEGDVLKRHFNRIALAFSLGPIIAPFIGGYLQHYFGWHANFFFILAYIFVASVVVSVFYRESATSLQAFSYRLLWHNYRQILSRRHFVTGCVFAACLAGPTMFFNVAGPFIVQVVMHKSAITFGHLALLVGLAWFLGSLTNQQLFHIKPHVKAWFCVGIMPVIALGMYLISLSGVFSIWLLMVPLLVLVYCCGGLFSLMVAECLTMFTTMAASVNAMFFSVAWVGVSVSSTIATLLYAHTLNPLSAALFLVSLLCLGLYILFAVQLSRSKA